VRGEARRGAGFEVEYRFRRSIGIYAGAGRQKGRKQDVKQSLEVEKEGRGRREGGKEGREGKPGRNVKEIGKEERLDA